MGKKKKIIIGAVSALVLCLSFGGGYLLSRNGGIEELLEETGLSKKSTKNKDAKKGDTDMDDGIDADAAGAGGGDAGNGDVSGGMGADGNQRTNFVDDGGASVGGTSPSESFSIKMSDLCTFSDPSGISFDTRYVLYGGSDCMPAKKVAAIGYKCKGVYVILYAKGGKAMGQYTCYVMSGESDAKGLASAFASKNDSSAFSYGNWGDVTYEYCSGSYVQTSIDTYYKSGAITSATPQAYLGMQFYFGGMSEYKSQSGSNGGGNSGNSSNPGNPSNPSNPGSPSNPSNPGNPSNPSNPSNPDNPVNPEPGPDNPDDPDDPSVPTKTSTLRGTSAGETFAVQIGTCRFSDPAGLVYDSRYVLKIDSSASQFIRYAGEGATEFYKIIYCKDDTVVDEYEGFVMTDSDLADQKAKDNEGSVKLQSIQVIKNVVIFRVKAEFTQSTIDNMRPTLESEGWKAPFHKAYLEEMYVNGGMEECTEGALDEVKPDVPAELRGTSPEESFSFRISEKVVFDEAKVRPEDYAVRYVLYTNKEQQGGLKEQYEILYVGEDGTALMDCKYYVAKDHEAAQALKDIGFIAGCTVEENVVYQHDESIQQTINMLASILGEATGEAYAKFLMAGTLSGVPMIELIPFPRAAAVPVFSQYVVAEILPEADPIAENENMLMEMAESIGIESQREVLSGNLFADVKDVLSEEAGEEEDFNPTDAGNITDETEEPGVSAEEEDFNPADAGNVQTPEAADLPDGQTPEVPPSDAAEETFDPASAGNSQIPETENFDPSQAGQAETPAAPAEGSNRDIRITPDYTFTDPQGIVYDARYVFHKDGDSELAAMLTAERNAVVSDVYVIFYVKDQKVLTEYRCFVMNGNAVCEETAQENLTNLIGSLPGMEKAYEANPKGYQEYIKEVYRLEELEEGDR